MDQPTTVTRIWDNGTGRPEFVRYTLMFADGRYASMNSVPLDNGRGMFWSSQGCPVIHEDEVEITWSELPSDCQEAVLIYLWEEEAVSDGRTDEPNFV